MKKKHKCCGAISDTTTSFSKGSTNMLVGHRSSCAFNKRKSVRTE